MDHSLCGIRAILGVVDMVGGGMMANYPMKHRFLGKHDRNCSAIKYAIQGDWSHPWCFERFHYGGYRRNLSKGGFGAAYLFRCNTQSCKAKLLILSEDFESVLGNRLMWGRLKGQGRWPKSPLESSVKP